MDSKIVILISFVNFFLFLEIQNTACFQPFLDSDIDYAASSIDLKNLIKIEAKLVLRFLEIFDTRKEDLIDPRRKDIMKEYLTDFKSTLLTDVDLSLKLFESLAKRSLLDLDGFAYDAVKHPFKSYRTIRRLVINLKKLKQSFLNTEVGMAIKEHEKLLPFPKQGDLDVSGFSVLRLNQLFKLPVHDFLIGKLGPINTSTVLEPRHLIEIGKIAIENNFYSQAVDFFASAFENYRGNWTFSKEIKDLLDEAIKTHDSTILADSFSDEDVQPDSGPFFFNNLLHNTSHENFKNRLPVPIEFIMGGVDPNEPKAHYIRNGYKFEKLCRGETEQTASDLKTLKCYLTHKNHPYFILSPLKVQVHNEDPMLIQYFDVVTEKQMQVLRDEVNGEMRMSRTITSPNDTSTTGRTTRFRTSSNAWITDYMVPKYKSLITRIGKMVEANSTGYFSTENLQIAAYSPGGHYVPHTDAVFEPELMDQLDPSEYDRGDRIITFMIYLSDVEYGGATVFPLIDAVVQPEKGSAVVWHNLNSDGSINRQTLHGGCSVVYGVKWIANKWIRAYDQMFLKQCPASKSPWTFNI